jgi:hypothetical protein
LVILFQRNWMLLSLLLHISYTIPNYQSVVFSQILCSDICAGVCRSNMNGLNLRSSDVNENIQLVEYFQQVKNSLWIERSPMLQKKWSV